MNKIPRSLAYTALALSLPIAGHAADVFQVATDGGAGWNSSTLWDNSAPASAGNDYFTVAGLGGSGSTAIGSPNVTSRVRGLSGSETFGGDSLTLAGGTEFLIKDAGPFTADIIMQENSVVRFGPNFSGPTTATLDGSLHVAGESWLGALLNGRTLVVSSTLTGSSMLHIAAGGGESSPGNATVAFDGDLSAFTGTFNIGGGDNGWAVTAGFDLSYDLSMASMLMGDFGTADVLDLNGDVTIGSFAFAGTSLAAGTYTIEDLNATFGDGSQFTSSFEGVDGTLTVVPEPGTYALLAGLATLAFVAVRRRARS